MTASTYEAKTKKDGIQRVLIVYPYTYINPHLCLPPLAAEYLQAGAVEAGKQTTLLDMRFEDDISEHVEGADLICLYGFFEDCDVFGKWGIHVIDEVLAQVPEGIPVLAGGTGFGDAEATLAKYPEIDVVIEGVPNIPMQQLLESGDPSQATNLVYRQDGEIVHSRRVTHRLSEDVFPRRELRNPAYEYHALGMQADLIRAAQGCNYKCRFCYQYGKDTDGNYLRWQGRSPESQFEELKQIEAPLLLWVDDDMTTDMDALERVSELMIENGLRKIMVGTGRVDHIVRSNVEALKKMERAGLIALAFGVESLKQETLRFYRKAQTVEKVEQAMAMMNQTNILLFCNFLLGSPGETEADMMKALDFGRRWDVDTLVTNRLRVPKGSEMYDVLMDPATGKQRPGMERIVDRELRRIKSSIKYGQRTPLRVLMSLLKLGRHEGLFLDPGYMLCCTIETLTKHTWIEKTYLVPAILFLPKQFARLPAFRSFTRFASTALTQPMRAVNTVFESVDTSIGMSTKILPAVFDYLRLHVLHRQKLRAQRVAGRAVKEGATG